ncbi:hypothetical protein DFH29DRAFT_886180 [Suillus ampliporus]|nr:hypothetical protein DFH29DRAFT_886180 [Suillus ampliporus]
MDMIMMECIWLLLASDVPAYGENVSITTPVRLQSFTMTPMLELPSPSIIELLVSASMWQKGSRSSIHRGELLSLLSDGMLPLYIHYASINQC